MGNRLGSQNHDYHLISDGKNLPKKYILFYISGGQKYPIPDNLKKFVKGAKVNKHGFIDEYINKFVICENYKILYDSFIFKIKPKMYNIYDINNESWLGKSNREMLVRSKISNPVNTHIIDKFYSNILIENMGKINDIELVKKRPNTIFIK